jgi:hypothetical protein
MAAGLMIGTPNQIAWAIQIKSQVEAELDRVRKVLEYAAAKESPENVTDIRAIIRILEDKRAEVMEHEQAGYFIHDWQDPGDLVSRLVIRDPGMSRSRQVKRPDLGRRVLADRTRTPHSQVSNGVREGEGANKGYLKTEPNRRTTRHRYLRGQPFHRRRIP